MVRELTKVINEDCGGWKPRVLVTPGPGPGKQVEDTTD